MRPRPVTGAPVVLLEQVPRCHRRICCPPPTQRGVGPGDLLVAFRSQMDQGLFVKEARVAALTADRERRRPQNGKNGPSKLIMRITYAVQHIPWRDRLRTREVFASKLEGVRGAAANAPSTGGHFGRIKNL